MSQQFIVEASSRESYGSGNSRRLRREGKVPGVIYGGGEEPQSLVLDHNSLIHQLENEAFVASILSIKTDEGTQKAILRDVQMHPYKPKILHVDFLRINSKEAFTMSVPLHVEGADVAAGVSEGGVVSHLVTDVEISCLPADLPEFLNVDISKLELGASAHLSDITLPDGVTLTALAAEEAEDYAVVAILAPRSVKSASEEAESGEGEEAPAE